MNYIFIYRNNVKVNSGSFYWAQDRNTKHHWQIYLLNSSCLIFWGAFFINEWVYLHDTGVSCLRNDWHNCAQSFIMCFTKIYNCMFQFCIILSFIGFMLKFCWQCFLETFFFCRRTSKQRTDFRPLADIKAFIFYLHPANHPVIYEKCGMR